MGLDSVELIMDVENTFQITISDPEAENISTVGDMYELVLKKIDYSDNHLCKTQVLFYKMREILSRHCHINRKTISPNTNLNDLFERDTIKSKWKAIQDELHITIPDLQRSDNLNSFLTWTSFFLVGFGLILIFIAFKFSLYYLILYSFAFFLLTHLIWRLTRHLKIYPIHGTMREFIHGITPIYLKDKDISVNDTNDILTILKYVIHDKIGAELEEITLDAHFVDDLGID